MIYERFEYSLLPFYASSLGAVTRTVFADAAPSVTIKPIAPEDIIKFELSEAT